MNDSESVFPDAEMIKVHFTPIKTRAGHYLAGRICASPPLGRHIINNDERCQLESTAAVAINYIHEIALKCEFMQPFMRANQFTRSRLQNKAARCVVCVLRAFFIKATVCVWM